MRSAAAPPTPRGAAAALEAASRRETEYYFAQALIVLVGFAHSLRSGATVGEIAAILALPAWFGARRRFRGGTTWLVLGVVTLLWGIGLSDVSSSTHLVSGPIRVQQSVELLGVVVGVGAVLYARTVLTPSRIGMLFGIGMLAAALLDRGAWRDNPWKFGLAVPVCLIVLGLAARSGRLLVQVVALAGLALVSVLLDSRAYSATLALTAVLLTWRLARSRSASGMTRVRVAALIAAVGVAVYLLASSLLVNGYLGRDAQARTIAQIQTSGSLLLGGRPELAATIALMKHHITGYGVGVVPTPNDILVAKSGLASINYAPNNGYVDRYMFGGQFELHSVLGDMWARWGLAGLVFVGFVAWVVVRALVEAVAGGAGELVTIFVCVWTGWNIAFSPFFASAPILVLAIGLGLRWRARTPATVS